VHFYRNCCRMFEAGWGRSERGTAGPVRVQGSAPYFSAEHVQEDSCQGRIARAGRALRQRLAGVWDRVIQNRKSWSSHG